MYGRLRCHMILGRVWHVYASEASAYFQVKPSMERFGAAGREEEAKKYIPYARGRVLCWGWVGRAEGYSSRTGGAARQR